MLEIVEIEEGQRFQGKCDGATFEAWGCLSGGSEIQSHAPTVDLPAIRFSLLPATLGEYAVVAKERSELLRIYVNGQA